LNEWAEGPSLEPMPLELQPVLRPSESEVILERIKEKTLNEIAIKEIIAPKNFTTFFLSNLTLGFAPLFPFSGKHFLWLLTSGNLFFAYIAMLILLVSFQNCIVLLLSKNILPDPEKGITAVKEVGTGEDELILTFSHPIRRPEVVYAKFLAYFTRWLIINLAFII
jgi:hypothetical protein